MAEPRRAETKQFDLVVLGDCNPDLILAGRHVEPRFGQVERLVDSAELTIGGSGSIVACGAARLGLRTALLAVVGDDLFGQFMVDALAQRGVSTEGVVVDPSLQTGLTVILDRGEDRAMLTYPGTIAALSERHLNASLLRQARHVHVSAFYLQRSLAPALADAFEAAKRSGTTTSVDPNWDPDERWDGGLKDLLSITDVFLPNAEEAMRIAAASTPREAAVELARRGPLVAVKCGREGAIAADRDGNVTEIPGPAGIEVVDTVGAGDSFDAGLLTGILDGRGTERSLALACACGALSTRAPGGTAAQPTLQEASERA